MYITHTHIYIYMYIIKFIKVLVFARFWPTTTTPFFQPLSTADSLRKSARGPGVQFFGQLNRVVLCDDHRDFPLGFPWLIMVSNG